MAAAARRHHPPTLARQRGRAIGGGWPSAVSESRALDGLGGHRLQYDGDLGLSVGPGRLSPHSPAAAAGAPPLPADPLPAGGAKGSGISAAAAPTAALSAAAEDAASAACASGVAAPPAAAGMSPEAA